MPRELSKSSLKKKAWAAFSKWIRQRDADENGYCKCVTCGKIDRWEKMQAGHGIGGRRNYLLFDETIIFAQCPACNIWGGGKYEEYAAFLIEQNGLEWYKEKLKYKVVQFTKKDLQDIIDRYTIEPF